MRKFALLAALAACVVAAFGTSTASAAISPSGTTVTGDTVPRGAVFTILGFFTLKCDSHVMFTTDGTNGPVPLHGTTTTDAPEWNNCDNASAVTTSGAWTIKALEAGELTSNNVDNSSTSVVTIAVPAGGAVIDNALGFTGCKITIGAANVQGNYTDGSTDVSVNSSSIPYTSSNCGGFIPASGTASYQAQYALDMNLLVT